MGCSEYRKGLGMKEIVIEEICSLVKKYDVKKVILFDPRSRGITVISGCGN